MEVGHLCMCSNLRRAARAITQLYDRRLKPSGLRATQLAVLVAARAMDAVPVTRMAAGLGMDRTTLTRNLRPLARRGLVEVRSSQDARVREVRLTERGRATLARALPLWERAQSAVAKSLGEARLRRLLSELADVATLS